MKRRHHASRLRSYFSDFRPRGLSRLLSERSMPEAARLSPRVRAPKLCRRRATAAANRLSPPKLLSTSLKIGALVCKYKQGSPPHNKYFKSRSLIQSQEG